MGACFTGMWWWFCICVAHPVCRHKCSQVPALHQACPECVHRFLHSRVCARVLERGGGERGALPAGLFVAKCWLRLVLAAACGAEEDKQIDSRSASGASAAP
eukprot:1148021-Pelagomonas_calceolata.AAC.3